MTKDNISTPNVIADRNRFMRHFLNQGAKYLGKVDRSHFDEGTLENMDKCKTGRELDVEYHLFDVNGLPIVQQFRIVDNKGERHFTILRDNGQREEVFITPPSKSET